MSDERWNPDNQGKQFSDDSNIVDSTAEVVGEASETSSGEDLKNYSAGSESAVGSGTNYSDSTDYRADREAARQYETYTPAPIPMPIMALLQETEITGMRTPTMSTIRATITAHLWAVVREADPAAEEKVSWQWCSLSCSACA